MKVTEIFKRYDLESIRNTLLKLNLATQQELDSQSVNMLLRRCNDYALREIEQELEKEFK